MVIHARVLLFYLLLFNNPDMSPWSSMPEFYLLTNNPDMSPWSSMPEFYLLSTTLTCPRFLLRPRGIFPRCQSHLSHFGARALTGTRFPFMRMDCISDFDFNAETLLAFILFRVLFCNHRQNPICSQSSSSAYRKPSLST